MKKLLFTLAVIAGSLHDYAQDAVITPGPVKHADIKGGRISLTTAHANIVIQAYSATLIRVRMSDLTLSDDFSYAVIAHPDEHLKVRTQESASTITLTTDSLQVKIGKEPLSISYYTPDGQVINEEEPGLGTSWIGSEVTAYRHMQEGERFIGLGEKTGNLDRRGNAYTHWNSDNFGYSVNQDPLYSTIPFYIGIHHQLQYGIFFDNSFQSDFNFGASNDRFASFGAKGGEMNYYFIYQPTVAGIITAYTALTGRMHMPPLWSLGYQQNRYSYYPEAEVFRIANTLREKQIPADGITLDIHYMDAYKLFTWNKDRFPDPKGMIDSLGKMGFKLTVIVDPGIKTENGYPAYESGMKENVFIKYADGQPYTGQVWPGWCHFPDFTSENGRAWWRGQIAGYSKVGVAGIWNDMNEISTWGQKMPSNVLFDYDGHPTTHLKGHNVFGLEMARSSYEGTRAAMNDQERPFILTRAGYAGLQRYSALWTGDNRAEDDHMLAGVRLLASLGLSGMPFTGMDIGGFTGNPSIGLYTRWMQLGAFVPYFRNHTAFDSRAAEPWSFGQEVQDIARSYIDLRYRILPYLYSTFHEATQDGLPVLRSLAIDYTHDPAIYRPDFQNEFLFGSAFLVLPQISGTAFSKAYFPVGDWYDLYTDNVQHGGTEKLIELSHATLPVYVKAGSIIPEQSLVQSTAEQPSDTLLLHIYKGPASRFDYYEDDGKSYRYEQGDYYQRTISLDPAARAITLDQPEGKGVSKFHHIRLVLHGFNNDQLKVPATRFLTSFLQTDPTVDPGTTCDTRSLLLDNRAERIVVNY